MGVRASVVTVEIHARDEELIAKRHGGPGLRCDVLIVRSLQDAQPNGMGVRASVVTSWL